MNKKCLILLSFFLSYLPLQTDQSLAVAGGYIVPHQTARALALSNAITAGVNDASAVYYNPAALGEVEGNTLQINGTYINAVTGIENSGRRAVNKHDDNFLASLFANYHIPGTDFSLGLGTYSPFGLATTYERDFTRFGAQRSELKTLFVTPAVSWHPSKYFSIGGGVSFVHASGLFSRALCFDVFFLDGGCSTPGGPFEGRLRVTDTANAFTYNLGLLFKPIASVKIGWTYRGRTDIRFDSADVKLTGAFSVNKVKGDVRPLPLPPVINTGIFWQISPVWGLEFVYEYTRWSEFKRFSSSFSPVPGFIPLGGFPVASFSLPQDWKNTSTLRLGSFYKLNKEWELRGGLAVEETPIPSKTLNPAIPGGDILTLNAGIGYKSGRVSVDLGYMAVFYKSRRVTNGEVEGLPATGIPFQGAPGRDKYSTFNNFVGISVSYRFDTDRPARQAAKEHIETANEPRPQTLSLKPESARKDVTDGRPAPNVEDPGVIPATSAQLLKVTPPETAVETPVAEKEAPVKSTDGLWAVQVNAFSNESYARDLARELNESGYDAYVAEADMNGQRWYRVRVGHLAARTEATDLQGVLKTKEKYSEAFLTSQ